MVPEKQESKTTKACLERASRTKVPRLRIGSAFSLKAVPASGRGASAGTR
jgi:hypothetical protein